MPKSKKVFRDPVHGLITFDKEAEKLLLDLIDTPEFQRLRRIRQLGVAWVAFHGAVHSRFSHSLGVCHLAGLYMDKIRDAHPDDFFPKDDEFRRARLLVRCASLLHDVGHGPFSHVFETAMKEAVEGYNLNHESWTKKIILDNNSEINAKIQEHSGTTGVIADDVARMIEKTYPDRVLVGIVSGPSDADRMDYLQRDSMFAGVRYGLIDQDWLLHSLRLGIFETGERIIAFDASKGINSIINFILARMNLFQQIYFHHKIRSAEVQLGKILRKIVGVIRNGDCRGSWQNLAAFAGGKLESPRPPEYLMLDDFSFLSHIHNMCHRDNDDVLQDLCEKFLNHKIFKNVEIPKYQMDKVDEIQNDIDKKCLREDGGNRFKDHALQYYRGIDYATKTYYEMNPPHEAKAEKDDENKEIGNEVYVIFDDNKPRPLSISDFSDLVKAIAPPFHQKTQKVRLCFDNGVFEKSKVEDIVRGGQDVS